MSKKLKGGLDQYGPEHCEV